VIEPVPNLLHQIFLMLHRLFVPSLSGLLCFLHLVITEPGFR
jgi:hypothetical protein